MEKKLDQILEKLSQLEERIERIEKDVKDVHHYVPFVGWLETQGKRIANIPRLPKLLWKKDE